MPTSDARGPELQPGRGWTASGYDAFGGMSNLVSLDALQEFRIQTSTFAPEFGRTPGGQVSVVTSPAPTFSRYCFEYFRNDVLDANDWFANNAVRRGRVAPERFRWRAGGPIR